MTQWSFFLLSFPFFSSSFSLCDGFAFWRYQRIFPPPASISSIDASPDEYRRSRRKQIVACSSSSSSLSAESNEQASVPSSLTDGVRLNKVFRATFSRREADKMIQDGRVSVNGKVCFGCMVVPFRDIVALDGKVVKGWEEMNGLVGSHQDGQRKAATQMATPATLITPVLTDAFEYVKYWKPKGVVCTTDVRVHQNIIDHITRKCGYQPRHRVYPVGRLDKDSSGLMLLTSDGRLPNLSLRKERKQPKLYEVTVDRPLFEADLEQLRDGIVITTFAQRDGNVKKALTAKTKPCHIQQTSRTSCSISLMEGRNRQIRKMMEALGYHVLDLHRTEFGEITLNSLKEEGDWARLDDTEMAWIQSLLSG